MVLTVQYWAGFYREWVEMGGGSLGSVGACQWILLNWTGKKKWELHEEFPFNQKAKRNRLK